ncbi:hypothetical protein IAR55_007078 [Kwoniella newhampshirensis]|uniref:NudC domain-containing protein 1 n=1 Tax=Kwoniella newhampshirensis TaxID=1651941 RepID=A0AAW0YSY8_9TREE
MPTFHPPLACTTSVPIPAATSTDSFVHLNFFVTFKSQEDSSGSWEIWTDLPRLDDQGRVIAEPGEWRAETFNLYQDVSLLEQEGDDSDGHLASPTVHLEALDAHPSAAKNPKTLYLSATVPASVDTSYSYTFRHVTEGGDIQWLGGVGGNGFIKLENGEVEVKEEPLTAGQWANNPSNLEKLDWRGVGIDLMGEKAPQISLVPSETAFSPTIALLEATPALHITPFSKISSSSSSLFPKPSTHHLAMVSSLSPLLFRASAILPSADSSQDAAYGLAIGKSLQDAVNAAFNKSKVDQSRIRLGKVFGKSTAKDDVVAIFSCTGEDRPVSTHLIVHAAHSSKSRDISVALPDTFDSAAFAVLAPSSTSAMYIPGGLSRELHFHFDAGATTQSLRLADFVEIRGAGSDDSIWICVPDAKVYEIGEEEMDLPKHSLGGTSLALADDVSSQVGSDTTQTTLSVPERETMDPKDAGEEDEGSAVGTDSSAEGGWFFRFIGRFFVNFWHFLLAAFRSKSSTKPDTIESDDEPEERFETQTPVDERTPLLDSVTLSRTTSSTAYSPMISPASETATKPAVKLSKNLNTLSKLIASNAADEELPVANSVKIRSYAQLTFDHPSPFKFFLPPGTKDAHDKLRFAFKAKGEATWEDVVPTMIDNEGSCVELVVAGGDGAGTEWEVRVEHI